MKYNKRQAENFMQLALVEAKKAFKLGEIPIGCVIVKDDKVIAKGHNLREHSHKTLGHAEVIAINQANDFLKSWRLNGCSLFVTLEPCIMCSGAILNGRFDEVYYGAPDSKSGVAGTLYDLLNDPRLNHSVNVQKGILEKQCLKLLQDFFELNRKK
ncbi:tRNA adenosine(34) deaminase TadA [Ligilactobacillus cholophilus]|uniref:tRNA adenosine(34) deaminase TadA n=1 Tax=Ligilactobacillus cholophilus TaxID=3050131 RepID=UPI0025AEEAFD|nr:tRNA adenosine(34) deaminase TadA [Ligilactobacillus cholophilus]